MVFSSPLRASANKHIQLKDAFDAQNVAHYQAWKSRYLKQGPCAVDELYVDSSGDAGEPNDITVSEAHGFGMLALVAMADIDEAAHTDFDRMVNLMRRHDVASDLPLMAWRLTETCASGDKAPSAPDGDIDMAYALLQAHAKWGNRGAHPYRDLAVQRITAMMNRVVQDANSHAPIMGLWEDIAEGDKYRGGTRLSDYIMHSFKAFAAATSDHRWLQLVAHGYSIMTKVQHQHMTGLLPDFVVVQGDDIRPAPPHYLEGELDGSYFYNACRLPWRLGADALINHDPRAKDVLHRLVEGLLNVSSHDPHKLLDGYALDGAVMGDKTDRLAFMAPMAHGLRCLDGMAKDAHIWTKAAQNQSTVGQKYYSETLRVVSALPLSHGP